MATNTFTATLTNTITAVVPTTVTYTDNEYSTVITSTSVVTDLTYVYHTTTATSMRVLQPGGLSPGWRRWFLVATGCVLAAVALLNLAVAAMWWHVNKYKREPGYDPMWIGQDEDVSGVYDPAYGGGGYAGRRHYDGD